MLVDSHAHLNNEQFNEDVESVIDKAKKSKVEYIIVNGFDLESSKKAVELASKYDIVYATVGVHPLDIEKFDDNTIDEIRNLASCDKVVAIGEIGLDYYYDKDKMQEQKEVFLKQLELARELDMPVTIHTRDSINDTYEILKKSGNYGVMHCYGGSVEYARKFIELGFYISLSGTVTFKNAVVPKEVAKEIDLEKLLIETDSPYLTPHPFRGKRNDPSFVRLVAKEIADLKEIDLRKVEDVTSANAIKLFNL